MNSLIPAIFLAAATVQAQAQETSLKTRQKPASRVNPDREVPITPPGSVSVAHFASHCIGCQLCVSNCPENVLEFSGFAFGMFQPTINYRHGYCRPNCNKCGVVCPAGAIGAINLADKKNIKIGLASVDRDRCIINRDKEQCTACYRISQQKAISLIALPESGSGRQQPFVDPEKCTGCGACEYVCPARPVSAITVNGFREHKNTPFNQV